MAEASGSYPVGSAPAGVEPPALPAAPEFDRRPTLPPLRFLGLLLVAAAPILAVVGLFGVTQRTVSAESEVVSLSVSYPRAQRFKVRAPLRLTLTNLSDAPLPQVTVSLSGTYLNGFSDVAITPGPDRISDERYTFELVDIAAGESRHLNLEMQAQSYWRTAGEVSWLALDASGTALDSGVAEFSTFTWP